MEAVKEMESVEKIQAINKTSWIQRMKSYKRTPLSFVLWLLVNVAMIATVAVLAYLIVYILVNGVPYLNSQLFELKYTSENASVFPAIINTHSIIYLTAGEFFDSFKSDDFKEFGSSKFDTSFFIECDLLIIDDLGTEKASDYNFSNLFNTINERLLRRKSIIISSNLEMPDIETRYSQRIFSRLVSAYSILRLFGDDIRCMKKLSPTKRS